MVPLTIMAVNGIGKVLRRNDDSPWAKVVGVAFVLLSFAVLIAYIVFEVLAGAWVSVSFMAAIIIVPLAMMFVAHFRRERRERKEKDGHNPT